MVASVSSTAPLSPFEYELLAERGTIAGDAAWKLGDYRRATTLWLSAARWEQTARRVPYSCQTGLYTIEQLGGEDCANCGRPFRVGDKSQPAKRIAEWQLFVHVDCPKVGASKC